MRRTVNARADPLRRCSRRSRGWIQIRRRTPNSGRRCRRSATISRSADSSLARSYCSKRGGARRAPLLVWQQYGRGATFVLATASTWRWQMQLPPEDQRHEMFWRQLLHAIAATAPPRASLTGRAK